MALRCKILAGVLGGAVAVTLACGATQSSAATAKKVTREEAWRICKAMLDREKTPSNMTTNDRYLRGGACMHKYGYRL